MTPAYIPVLFVPSSWPTATRKAGHIITCWYRDLGEGLKFNHISDGFNADHDEPAYLFESQRLAWRGGIWIGVKAELDDGKVIGGARVVPA